MGMTVAEKEALQAILKQKIDDRIEGLKDEAEAEFEEMEAQAEIHACMDLGIRDEFGEATALYLQIQRDKKRIKRMWRDMAVKLGLDYSTWNAHANVMSKVEKVAGKRKRTMMADHPVGKQILNLEKEKKEMLGTIWLATSTKQVKDLWKQLDDLLGNRMTQLEKEVLAIEPVKD